MISKANWITFNDQEVPKVVHFQNSDLLSFSPESRFDVVFSFAVLYYVTPMEAMIPKIQHWLKPGDV